MSDRFQDDLETTLAEFGELTIHPCKFRMEADDTDYVDGYAVLFTRDGVVQARMAAYAQAVSAAMQWGQVLQMEKAYREQEESEASMEGLMSTGGEDDVEIH